MRYHSTCTVYRKHLDVADVGRRPNDGAPAAVSDPELICSLADVQTVPRSSVRLKTAFLLLCPMAPGVCRPLPASWWIDTFEGDARERRECKAATADWYERAQRAPRRLTRHESHNAL